MQGLHTVAYQGALGRPLVCPEDCIGGLNADVLASYVEQNFKANRIVFAGSGMEHQELVSLVEPLVSSMKASSQAEQPASTYIGGDFRYAHDDLVWRVTNIMPSGFRLAAFGTFREALGGTQVTGCSHVAKQGYLYLLRDCTV